MNIGLSGRIDTNLVLDGLDQRRGNVAPADVCFDKGLEGFFLLDEGLDLLVVANLLHQILGFILIQLVIQKKGYPMNQLIVLHSLLVCVNNRCPSPPVFPGSGYVEEL